MGQKILIVEDNELNLKLFCDLLRAHGYDAEPVRDGREALDRARAFGPDLVVMDIQMPHVSGLELIEQMKSDETLRATPIMAVTAYAAKGDEERIRDAGAEGYVAKPISVPRFVDAVAQLLAQAGEEPVVAASPEEAAAAAVEAAAQSGAIEAAAKAAAPAAEARALDAAAGADELAVEAIHNAEHGPEAGEDLQSPDDRDADESDGAKAVENPDPGVRREEAGPDG